MFRAIPELDRFATHLPTFFFFFNGNQPKAVVPSVLYNTEKDVFILLKQLKQAKSQAFCKETSSSWFSLDINNIFLKIGDG